MGKKYSIRFLPLVEKDLKKIDTPFKKIILSQIFEKLSFTPELFSKPLSHTLHPWRTLRVGHYRVIFEVQNKEINILVIAIGHRKNIYKTSDKRKK